MDPPAANRSKETLRGGKGSVRYGASAMQGWRDSMEDAHICHVFPNGHALFCVLDGHGGPEAAEFAQDEMTRLLTDTPEWQSYTQRIAGTKGDASHKTQKEWTTLLQKALTRSFVELDRELYLNHYYGEEEGASSAGSTAVAVLWTPFGILCANIGDSRCVLASSSTATPHSVTAHPLSQDHKPTLKPEEERIHRAGGVVCFGRVDGELAVSRAFGDFEFKNLSGLMLDSYDTTDNDDVETLLERAQTQKVSAYPEIKVHPNNDTTDRFLVLACDGIWDVVSNEDCVEWIAGLLQQGQDDLGGICEQMVDKCLQQGSQDNMTIVIVLLEAGQKLIGKTAAVAKK